MVHHLGGWSAGQCAESKSGIPGSQASIRTRFGGVNVPRGARGDPVLNEEALLTGYRIGLEQTMLTLHRSGQGKVVIGERGFALRLRGGAVGILIWFSRGPSG